MTRVTIFKHEDIIVEFSCEGHTGYAEYGGDIVCASVSSIVQSCGLGLTKVLGLKCKITQNDDKGIYTLRLPKELTGETMAKAQVLLATMFLSIKDLEKGYPSNIKVEVKKL